MNRRTSGLLNRRPKPRTEIVRREVLEEVVMHQLIPIEDFKEEHLKKETCSYVNTTPIWDSIHKGSLKNVEQYIRGIADVSKPIVAKVKKKCLPTYRYFIITFLL